MKHKLFLVSPMLAMMLAVGMAEVAHATLFQYEGANYADPSTALSARSGGGTGWSGSSWSQSGTFNTTASNGLSFGGVNQTLNTSAGAITASASGSNGGVIRTRQGTGGGTDTSGDFTRWFSLLVKVDSLANNLGTGFSASIAPYYKSAGQAGTGFGAVWDSSSSSYKFKLFVDGGVQTSDVTTAGNVTMLTGQTMLLVGKFMNTSSQDALEMWLNPTDSSLGGANLVGQSGALGYLTHTHLFASGGQVGDARFSITDVAAFQGSFDEIRIGDSYASVTPATLVVAVPEVSAFLAVGLVGIVSWSINGGRRRRRQDG